MTYDWVVLDEDWESCGPDISTAIDGLDDGDEVTVLCFRQIDRRYRFETVDGVPTLVDTDPATAPTETDFSSEPDQPSLFEAMTTTPEGLRAALAKSETPSDV